MSQFLSTARLRRSMLNDVLPLATPASWILLIQLVVTALLYLAYDRDGGGEDIPIAQSIFAAYLMIVGLVMTSMSFRDMHHPLERYRYLMLPISNFERYLGRYLLTGPLYVLFMLVAFTLMDATGNLVTHLVLGVTEPRFDQFSKITGFTLCGYLVCHALMFTGAIAFRSYALIKTVLTVIGVQFSTMVVGYIAARVFYPGAFSWKRFSPVNDLHVMFEPQFVGRWLNIGVGVLFLVWILYVAYRCLKAHEVQDEL
jgi:hypothetical protein